MDNDRSVCNYYYYCCCCCCFRCWLLMVKCRLSMRMEDLWNDTDGGKPEGFGEKPIAVPVVQLART
jgi:hypothetical protein